MKLRKFGAIALVTLSVSGLLPSLQKLPMPLWESSVLAQTVDERQREADRLLQQGLDLFNSNESQKALQVLQQALNIYTEICTIPEENFNLSPCLKKAQSLSYLGETYFLLEDYEKAIELLEKSLISIEQVNSFQGSTICIKVLCLNRGESNIPVTDVIGNFDNVQIQSLTNLVFAHIFLGEYRQATDYHQQSLDIYQEIDDAVEEAYYLNKLGVIYRSQGEYKQATNFLKQSLAIYREIRNRQGEANSLNDLGNVYADLGESKQAVDFHTQSLAIRREIDDRQGEASSLNNLGAAYFGLGEYQKAIDFHRKSLAILQETEDRRLEVASLNNIGNAHVGLGEYRQAIDFYQQSLAIAREIGDRQRVADSLNNLGAAYYSLGEYEQAIDFNEQSLAIKKEIGDRQGVASSLDNLGTVYDSVGDYARAIDFREQSLAVFQDIGDRRGEANSLGNFGLVYDILGEYEQAIDFLQQALAISREIEDFQRESIILLNLGNAFKGLGEYEQAIDFYQKSLEIAKKIGDRQGIGDALGNLGGSYRSLRKYEQAIDFQEQSLAIKREIEDRRGEAISLGNLGNIYNYLGKHKRAIDFQEQSLAIAREIKNIEGEANSLRNLGFALTNAGNLTKAETQFYKAIDIHEKIRELLGLKDAWKVSIFEGQARTYRGLQKVLVAQNKPQKALEISEQGRARALVELSLRKLSPKLKEEFTPQSPNLAEIKAIAKEQNATLVEYSLVYNNQIYIWVIPPDGEIQFRSVNLPKDTSLNELVQASRQSLGARNRGEDDSTLNRTENTNYRREFHQLLIEPIAEFLPQNEEERIIFIPDKELFLVPFAALQDANYTYLIEKHTILTAPSIQALGLTHQHRKRVENASGDILIVGNPKMPQNKQGQTLSPLPGAKEEAEAIARILKAKPIIGSQATEPAILAKMANAKIIHLATHGILGEVDSSPGAIALTPAGEDDGYLTTREIMESFGLAATPPLKAELVVLSACDTGRGDIRSEGVVGLSRSLIAAGVPTIVVSLWKVPDDATADLMSEFYHNIYERKFDKAQAMRQAMLTMIKGENPDPVDWAAFTVIGEAE